MKKLLFGGIIIFGIILSCIAFFTLNIVNTKELINGTVIFIYGDNNINESLSQNDLNFLIDLFDNKIMYRDDPSCGFSKNVSILFNDSEYFCFACDTCPVVYWESRNKYFRLSDLEYKELVEMLSEYGVFFPCIWFFYTISAK